MQPPQAIFHPEPRIHRRYDISADGEAYGALLVIERLQPRHTSLANFALPIIEQNSADPSIAGRVSAGFSAISATGCSGIRVSPVCHT